MRLHTVALLLVGCSAPKEPGKAGFTHPAGTAGAPPETTTSVAPAPSPSIAPARDEDPFAKLGADFTACYEEGKKAIPTMTSGKVTLHAAVDASGKTSCAVPSDDTGLTPEVEKCMLARLDREPWTKRDAPWSLAIPIVVKDGILGPGELRGAPKTIETVESQGLAEDVYDVVDALLPQLYECVRGIPRTGDLRVVYVGARVGSAGNVECALASGPSSIPIDTRTCTAKVLGRAKFRAPKHGYGLVSVPLNLTK